MRALLKIAATLATGLAARLSQCRIESVSPVPRWLFNLKFRAAMGMVLGAPRWSLRTRSGLSRHLIAAAGIEMTPDAEAARASVI